MNLGPKAEAAAKVMADTLLAMTLENDARLLAPVMGTMAARLYQGLLAAGIHSPEDVKACMESFVTMAMEPMPSPPTVNTLPLSRTAQ